MNVFSFCLYNPYNPYYYEGLIENLDIIRKHFPSWGVFVYIGNDVPPEFIERLSALPNVFLRMTGETGSINMIHRFFAIDEPDVECMFVRDADSRVFWKDRWAIRDFLDRPEFIAHAIRDNEEHRIPLLGGLWALRKSSGLSMRSLYASYDSSKARPVNGLDQTFLNAAVYPLVKERLLVHHGKGYLNPSEKVIKFPFKHSTSLFCGQGIVTLGSKQPDVLPPLSAFNVPQAIVRMKN